ncbi:hypothetical protein NQ318_014121 [Aromia moschata]|uniref:Uncharacterized protein n=1 Tax=Aromia moschata TaxID=1265417 RepID=A0AAV8XKZ8_9CUCU|nr:hypothetical protein NQ318_014121 [Aromia moschata]
MDDSKELTVPIQFKLNLPVENEQTNFNIPYKELIGKEKHISSEQHEHVQRVWCEFDILNLGEYTDLYLKTDILLLCDFIASCLKTYDLDPAPYYTLPGYTWNCMLKYTKEELELQTYVNHLILFEEEKEED